MTAGKWNGLLMASLGLLILLGVGAPVFVMVFITPKLAHLYQEAGVDLPGYLQTVISVCDVFRKTYLIWPVIVGVGFWQFERRCKNEHKPALRNVLLSGMALTMVMLAFWILGTTLAATIQIAIFGVSGGA